MFHVMGSGLSINSFNIVRWFVLTTNTRSADGQNQSIILVIKIPTCMELRKCKVIKCLMFKISSYPRFFMTNSSQEGKINQ